MLAAVQALGERLQIKQSALIQHSEKEPVLILDGVFNKEEADWLAERCQHAISLYPDKDYTDVRRRKGARRRGIAIDHGWCGQDGYQE